MSRIPISVLWLGTNACAGVEGRQARFGWKKRETDSKKSAKKFEERENEQRQERENERKRKIKERKNSWAS